jgi:hypothetical protein
MSVESLSAFNICSTAIEQRYAHGKQDADTAEGNIRQETANRTSIPLIYNAQHASREPIQSD